MAGTSTGPQLSNPSQWLRVGYTALVLHMFYICCETGAMRLMKDEMCPSGHLGRGIPALVSYKTLP